jgi:carbamoylphosphate synthase large subunit
MKYDDKSDFKNARNFGKDERISIHLLFIDFRSVYDSSDREQVYVAMNELHIPWK